MPRPVYPPIVTWFVTLWTAVLIPAYWAYYGPGNFLWFSDIALFVMVLVLWKGWCLPFSMMAVGVLPLEIAWLVDFLSGGRIIGLAGYMFEADRALHIRALSLFHLFLPPLAIWMLWRQGYDRRALRAQTLLAWLVLPATWLLTAREDNINWVHGFGEAGETFLPPLGHLAFLMFALPLAVYLPVHLLLRRLCRPCGPIPESEKGHWARPRR